jgi:uncharacterized protein (TIGR03066 family)
MPPDIPEFAKPAPKVEEKVEPELAADEPETAPAEPEPEPEPEPEAKKVEEKKPEPKKPEPKPEPVEEVEAAPTLVGTWRVVEMSHGGQTSPEMSQMEMTFTFTADGNFTMSMSMPQMDRTHTQEGTYSLEGDQLTITADGRDQTGTCTFEGNDRVVLEISGGRMVLSRT